MLYIAYEKGCFLLSMSLGTIIKTPENFIYAAEGRVPFLRVTGIRNMRLGNVLVQLAVTDKKLSKADAHQ